MHTLVRGGDYAMEGREAVRRAGIVNPKPIAKCNLPRSERILVIRT
jgi:hypothetical protein